ncbi:MAG: MarR family transcriptional regulator [Deltaproteobacteria bacterium]|nr:MarR family transcriptional regulator [Deltaproteobacteria bacterium]
MNKTHTDKNKIVIDLLRIGSYLLRTGNRLLSDFDLNHQQFVVLRQIYLHGPICQKDICSQLFFEKSNISKIVKKLQSNNLIKNIYCSRDSRINQLVITKKGQGIINKGMDIFNGWNDEWLQTLSEKEISQAIMILEKLNKQI